jgi:hypothetical protein
MTTLSYRCIPITKGKEYKAMTRVENSKGFTFDRPGNYRIRVQGFLNQSWSEGWGGMDITINRVWAKDFGF